MHYFINAARGQAKACPTMRRLLLLSFHLFAGRDEFVERLVGQISNLRRISNPPGAPVASHFGAGVGALVGEAPRRGLGCGYAALWDRRSFCVVCWDGPAACETP